MKAGTKARPVLKLRLYPTIGTRPASFEHSPSPIFFVQMIFGRISSEPGANGIFVISSSFSRNAAELAKSASIIPIDGTELERLVVRHHLL
jgi:hypothetical protein